MIEIKEINGSPEFIPEKHVGSLFTGESFMFFENEEEKLKYLSKLPVIWDINSYCEEVNEAHNQLFKELYTERNYLNIGEISLWLNDKEYGTEAQELITWWKTTCKEVEEYLNNITKETALPIQDFINKL